MKPVSQRFGPRPLLLLLALLVCCTSAAADRLRISPDDLRLRVAVSEELPPSLRREIRDLARSSPLPVENGLVQTEQLLKATFADRGWKPKRTAMVRYYFLVARLEQSQQFSDEFLRRRLLMEKGVDLLNTYLATLNRQIGRAVYTAASPVEPPQIAEFPLSEVEQSETGELKILRHYPPPDIELGRENLRTLRDFAGQEKVLLEQQLERLEQGEARFLSEVSTLGQELLAMREEIRGWVRVPGEGLPFSF
ncbi:MAG: hypothetical protein WC314_10365 [Vulcanimicrobiota bacterium]